MEEFEDYLIEYLCEVPRRDLHKATKYAADVEGEYTLDTSEEFNVKAQMMDQKTDDFYEVEIDCEISDIWTDCECQTFRKTRNCIHINTVIAAHLAHLYTKANSEKKPVNAEQILKWAAEDLLDLRYFSLTDDVLQASKPVIKKLENEWFELNVDPSRIYSTIVYELNQKYANIKAIQALTKIVEDKVSRYWKYSYLHSKTTKYEVQIKYDGQHTFHFNCTCGNKNGCLHIVALVQSLDNGYNDYFLKCKDLDDEKNKLLAEYGFSLNDPEAELFSFDFNYGKIKMTAPGWAIKISDTKKVQDLAKTLLPPQKAAAFLRPKPSSEVVIDFEPGFLLNLANSRLPFMQYELEVIKVQAPKAKGQLRVAKLDTHLPQNLPLLGSLPNEVFAIMYNISKPALERYAVEALEYNPNVYYAKWTNLPDRIIQAIGKYYREQLRLLWPYLKTHPHFYVMFEGRFGPTNIHPAKALLPFFDLKPTINVDAKFITLAIENNLNTSNKLITGNELQNSADEPAELQEKKSGFHKIFSYVNWRWYYSFFYVSKQGEIALPANDKDLEWFKLLHGGLQRIPIQLKEEVIRTLIPALEQRLGHPLELPASLAVKRINATPQPRVVVAEYMEKYLMFLPQFMYENNLVDFSRNETEIWLKPSENITTDGHIANQEQTLITRDTAAEIAFYESLRPLHPTFARQLQNDFYYLPFDQVMINQWFIKTLQLLSEQNVAVYGLEKLKKFRYSALKPKWEMKAGSQTDWFDLKIEVKFGEEIIPLKTIRKAFASGQQVIMLNDGSLGVLPDEWLKQYGSLLKLGQEKEAGTLRLSKLHYTLIEALHNDIDDETVLAELADKKQRLLAIENVTEVALPKQIKAKLRPYQVSGFTWMNTLEQMGWGGCLADDMGLGKTLQTITFLQHLKAQYPSSTHLVVCPTSLLYNWENELRKFAPKLKFWLHYGLVRQLTADEFKEHDLIITSYGLVRSDIELLKSFEWHYLILDESQAIKNPDALTTRALHLLQAKNRLILSGTPLQNNTYDLYAQFNFLNPGMLGSREFFREEFANPIDKNRDPHKAETLRRLLHPFMLRRTKAQVAPDLPAKTETILWCDMPKEQQQVYDDYKLQYRQALMQKIEEAGMAKAGMLIIEGLLRLRQICNSPRLLKQNEYANHASVKIDELMREISENTGGHKLLVFSQFTEMLHLVQTELENSNIGFAYLDGSTPAAKRKQAVELFQENESIRVFLISLKAGGVGLNLTAADYVYLIDPWWNPAAEQQAIDRTHRIGQKQKIFAYKMICRNTVEEKILELQNRKRKLAGDLVGEDEAVAKNLTKEDIAFLFS